MGLFFQRGLYAAPKRMPARRRRPERFLRACVDNGSEPGFYEPFLEDVVIANDQLLNSIVLPGEVGMG